MEIQRQRRALILALGVCYIARLEQRDNYINFISSHFTKLFTLEGPEEITAEIQRYINVYKLIYNGCKVVYKELHKKFLFSIASIYCAWVLYFMLSKRHLTFVFVNSESFRILKYLL